VGEKTEVTASRRIVFDTNVAVSALVFRNGRLAWLRGAWEMGRVIPLVSGDTLGELLRVLAYQKLKLIEDDAMAIVSHYMEHAEAVGKVGKPKIPPCRDPDDELFLRLAYAAKAASLVTGDKDLLALAKQSRIPIMTPESLRNAMKL
jgi:uncharacterized protein